MWGTGAASWRSKAVPCIPHPNLRHLLGEARGLPVAEATGAF